ncbi:hypothetical protein C2S53_007444 [Perilla frutescens var. hirtella]|uniref:Uncharacterized protein n=1 Tax=Perilla frutescens var. hirtella TaxID=608512 RepID=A0AAD4PAE6_PERFH|nr:hypothetical protein C2S53_007444 [Perilla frutescens var. hirtella]
MFSRNTYLIPSSHHHPRPTTSVFDLDGVEVLLHQQQQHHHHQQHPGVYLDNNATFFHNGGGLNGGDQPCSSSGVVHHEPKAAAAAKKDRHSKIHTAQGPRDRRVRLSIGIARKFFDLQEMLGFDKPSKTLDWLLTKSKEAIEELLQQTKQKATASGSSPSDDQCEQLDFEGGSADSRRRHNKAAAAAGKEPHQQQQQQAKESRAKARARARERTLEKMCFKQLGGGGGGGATTHNASDLNVNELEFLQLSAAGAGKTTTATTTTTRTGFPHHLPLSNESDLIEESIFIKRKSKNPSSSVLGFQQNLVFSRDLNSNHMIPSSANYSNENWDVFGFSSQSNLHAIFDQHRFINR